MCTAGGSRRRHSTGNAPSQVPDPTEVLHTCKGGAIDPHTRLGGYTWSTMCGVSQVWFVAHHVGHVMKTLRSGRLEELHRRMKRNPHVLDVKVCRAVLWWNILGEAMDAAREAQTRRSRRRETKQLVVALAISQRREGGKPPEALSKNAEIEDLCPPSLLSDESDDFVPSSPSREGTKSSYPRSPLSENAENEVCPLCWLREDVDMLSVASSFSRGIQASYTPAPFGGGMESWLPPRPLSTDNAADTEECVQCGGEKTDEDRGTVGGGYHEVVHLDEAAVLRRIYDYL